MNAAGARAPPQCHRRSSLNYATFALKNGDVATSGLTQRFTTLETSRRLQHTRKSAKSDTFARRMRLPRSQSNSHTRSLHSSVPVSRLRAEQLWRQGRGAQEKLWVGAFCRSVSDELHFKEQPSGLKAEGGLAARLARRFNDARNSLPAATHRKSNNVSAVLFHDGCF